MTAVKTWLEDAGIHSSRIKHSQSLSWLNFNASVDKTEDLLNARYHIYDHAETGQPHVACEQYSLPAHLQKHIDFVYPTVHFDAKVISRQESNHKKRQSRYQTGYNVATEVGQPYSGSLPKLGAWMQKSSLIKQLEQCNQQITPNCLRALYRFAPNFKAVKGNSYGIVECKFNQMDRQIVPETAADYRKPRHTAGVCARGSGPFLRQLQRSRDRQPANPRLYRRRHCAADEQVFQLQWRIGP